MHFGKTTNYATLTEKFNYMLRATNLGEGQYFSNHCAICFLNVIRLASMWMLIRPYKRQPVFYVKVFDLPAYENPSLVQQLVPNCNFFFFYLELEVYEFNSIIFDTAQ